MGGAAASGEAARGEQLFRRECTSCHTIGLGDERGPDLMGVTTRRPNGWLSRWLTDPQATAAATTYGAKLVEQWGVVMPDPGLDSEGIADVLAFIAKQSSTGPLAPSEPVTLSAADLDATRQQPVPEPPTFDLAQARASWQLLVAPSARPTSPEHSRDWENFFGVVLRDAGEVAIFDGDTKEELVRIDTGFAVHILRSSSTGRYFYAVGRDGWVTLIDLWASVPQAVARARGCFDARSVESSKYSGYEDRYLIEGCYWPSQYVVFDGATLEPLSLTAVLANTVDTNQPLSEVRVASIVASHYGSYWALALKESGHVVMVDYSDPAFPTTTKIGVERFLHDGGLDHTGRYFLVAANARDRMGVVDLQSQSLVTTIETGALPHPGRGANWQDPTFGWVNATTHLGEGKLAIYGADPAGQPANAWKVLREIALPSAGSLFLKTHPRSPWVLFDMTLSTDTSAPSDVCAYSKAAGTLDHCFTPSAGGRAVHFEFNRTGY